MTTSQARLIPRRSARCRPSRTVCVLQSSNAIQRERSRRFHQCWGPGSRGPTQWRPASRAVKVGRSPGRVETARSYRRAREKSVLRWEGDFAFSGTAMTRRISGFATRIPSVPANTSASIAAMGQANLSERMSGVARSTSPIRRVTMTRMESGGFTDTGLPLALP